MRFGDHLPAVEVRHVLRLRPLGRTFAAVELQLPEVLLRQRRQAAVRGQGKARRNASRKAVPQLLLGDVSHVRRPLSFRLPPVLAAEMTRQRLHKPLLGRGANRSRRHFKALQFPGVPPEIGKPPGAKLL